MTGIDGAEAVRRLEGRGYRATPQRLSVLAALAARPTHVTAQDLHADLRASGERLGLATVYRTLELLAQCDLAARFPQPNNEVCYVYCSARHHHHLVCTGCGRVAEIPGCALQPVQQDIERAHDFTITGHTLTFFGTCASCSSQ